MHENTLVCAQVGISGEEQLALAEREVAFMKVLQHPNLLPLLDSSVERVAGPEATSQEVVYLLFPLYTVSPSHIIGVLMSISQRRSCSSLCEPPCLGREERVKQIYSRMHTVEREIYFKSHNSL